MRDDAEFLDRIVEDAMRDRREQPWRQAPSDWGLARHRHRFGGARRRWQPIGMADPIIAAIALEHGLEFVTGNTAHFQLLSDLLCLARKFGHSTGE